MMFPGATLDEVTARIDIQTRARGRKIHWAGVMSNDGEVMAHCAVYREFTRKHMLFTFVWDRVTCVKCLRAIHFELLALDRQRVPALVAS